MRQNSSWSSSEYPPPPQPFRGPCCSAAAPRRRPSSWFSRSCAATPAPQTVVGHPGGVTPPKGSHGGGRRRRRAAPGRRGPEAGRNLTIREARERARSADSGQWGGSLPTSVGSSSRSDFGERGRPPRRTCGARGDEDAPMRTSRPVAKRESRWSCLRCDMAGTNAIAGRGRGLKTERFREYSGAPDSSLNG